MSDNTNIFLKLFCPIGYSVIIEIFFSKSLYEIRQYNYFYFVLQAFVLFWVLMESASEDAYDAVLRQIRIIMPHLRPTQILTDFERALQLKVEQHFSPANLHASYFHFLLVNISLCLRKVSNI